MASAATKRSTTADKLSRELSGDLDTSRIDRLEAKIVEIVRVKDGRAGGKLPGVA